MDSIYLKPPKNFLAVNSWNRNWFFKYKLYHIFFWLGYHYLWAVMKTGDPIGVVNYIFFSPASVKFIFYVVFQAIAVYLNLYFLIPTYLEKKRYGRYVLYVSVVILLTAMTIVSGYYLSARFTGTTVNELYGTARFSYFLITYSLPSTLAAMMLAMSIKLTKNWIQARQRERLLEKEKLETELKFLRSQFNPHFLFNSINSIFVLINKNPDMAADSLAKFSELLRYQLYECNEPYIPVLQELKYLENFIELERIRHSNIELRCSIEPPKVNAEIAPFILLPFIENTFKHVSKEGNNWIIISLRFKQTEMFLSVANSVGHGNAVSGVIRSNGIGLKNVKRRLDLLYPGMHDLKFLRDKEQFKVELYLNLSLRKTLKVETATWPE